MHTDPNNLIRSNGKRPGPVLVSLAGRQTVMLRDDRLVSFFSVSFSLLHDDYEDYYNNNNSNNKVIKK